MNIIVYPIIARAIWSPYGYFFRIGYEYGIIDCAGSGVINLVAGASSLAYSLVYYEFCKKKEPVVEEINLNHSYQDIDVPIIKDDLSSFTVISNVKYGMLGVMLILFGGYGLVSGQSTVRVANKNPTLSPETYELISVNFTICFLAAGATAIILYYFVRNIIDRNNLFGMQFYCNCFLAAMAAIAAGAPIVQPASAFFIGIVSTLIYAWCITKFKSTEDPCKSYFVHGVGGMWGLISVGLFADPKKIFDYYGNELHYGLITGGGYTQILLQLLAIVLIIIFSSIFIYCPLKIIKMIKPDLIFESRQLDSTVFTGEDRYIVLWQVLFKKHKVIAQYAQFKLS